MEANQFKTLMETLDGIGSAMLAAFAEGKTMKQPGLDNRNRDEDGEIRQKRGDTLNKNLPQPIPQFSPLARLDTMRKETGKTSEGDVRKAAKRRS